MYKSPNHSHLLMLCRKHEAMHKKNLNQTTSASYDSGSSHRASSLQLSATMAELAARDRKHQELGDALVERRHHEVTIVGAGLVGSLLAVVLRSRGYRVTVYEGRRDPRRTS